VSDLRLSPAQALARLERGNQRWADGRPEHPDQDLDRRRQVAAGQDPFATIVSCIDSRLPPEIIFDQGIGDLFAVRTGAQTIDGLVTASIEYGPLENGTPLILVLGHARCGAVTAAVRAIQDSESLPGHLDTIVQQLRPAYDDASGQPGDLIDQVVRAQIHRTVRTLAHDGPLSDLVARQSLGIVGAYYDLDSGVATRLLAHGL
jgi:carbonic anhydrase